MTKRTNRILQIIVGLLLTVTLSGCFGVNENFEQIRNNILSNIDGSYSKNTEMGFGSITLSLAEIFVSFSNEENAGFITDALDNVSEVQVGTYTGKAADKQMDFRFLKKATAKLTGYGWQTLIRVKSQGSLVAILYKESGDDSIENMLILTRSGNGLVLVELYGNLTEIVELALKENGENFNIVDNF